ncbi:hypothetical protein ACIREE_25465 [Streptomyces sp. NPDC102467]|uniref:hypothetical protein n=1 Tax=Streptomyces sp. NPDC102467 TaxID=3366179 RepID=UPI0038032F79
MAMSRQTKVRGAAVAVAMAAAGAAVTVQPAAAAADGPRFLAPAELPPHPASKWFAGPVTAGQPDPLPLCVGEALPSTSVHRVFRTDYDTGALQVTVVERSTQRAKAFAALLREKLDACATTVMNEQPDITATQKYYGRVAVEDGAYVYGVHTESTGGASDINLFSVGRDGTAVTVVQWGQLGGYEGAPVASFKKTTATAVRKLQ